MERISPGAGEWAEWIRNQIRAGRRTEHIAADLRLKGLESDKALLLVGAVGERLGPIPRCSAWDSRRASRMASVRIELGLVLGLLGSATLFVGVFLPILRVPIVGQLNYFQNGKGDGVLLICVAVISVAICASGQLKWLWATGLASIGLLAFTFINFHMRMGQARSELQRELADNPFRGLGELAIQSVQLEWGWAVLVLGALMLIGGAVIERDAEMA